jgi:flagellar FliL protein
MADGEEVQRELQKESAPAGKNPLLTVVMLLNTALMAGVAYLQFENHKKITEQLTTIDIHKSSEKLPVAEGEEEIDTGEAQEEDGILHPLDNFTANLAQGDGPRRFVRMSTVLKFSKDSSEEEFKAREPQIRDAIISTLNSKRPNDLLKVEGKNFLKEEIKASINTFLVDGKVIDVFYISFQIN